MSRSAPPVEDGRVARTRARVMSAAVGILRDVGPSALTIDEVIRRSGVARMTVYRHWPSRDDLLYDAFRALVPRPGAPDHAMTGSALDRLAAAVVAYGREFSTAEWADAIPGLLEYARRHPEHAVIWVDFAAARGEHLGRLIADCVADGLLGPVDTDMVISQLMGPIAFRRFLSFEPITDEFCLELVRDLVAAHPPP